MVNWTPGQNVCVWSRGGVSICCVDSVTWSVFSGTTGALDSGSGGTMPASWSCDRGALCSGMVLPGSLACASAPKGTSAVTSMRTSSTHMNLPRSSRG